MNPLTAKDILVALQNYSMELVKTVEPKGARITWRLEPGARSVATAIAEHAIRDPSVHVASELRRGAWLEQRFVWRDEAA